MQKELHVRCKKSYIVLSSTSFCIKHNHISLSSSTDPTVSLAASVFNVSENDGTVQVCGVLSLLALEFPSGLTGTLTVDIATTDDTAGTV